MKHIIIIGLGSLSCCLREAIGRDLGKLRFSDCLSELFVRATECRGRPIKRKSGGGSGRAG